MNWPYFRSSKLFQARDKRIEDNETNKYATYFAHVVGQ